MNAAFELDIFRSDKKTVDTQKILLKIWENRNNAEMVSNLAEILSKYVDEKKIFSEVEFYLPQFAHLMVHLDQPPSTGRGLEMLAVAIAQASPHAALQMGQMFHAAMEDYQPESSNHHRNPVQNPFYFNRCARLLRDLERSFIWGSPHMSESESSLWRARAKSQTNGKPVEDVKEFKRNEIAGVLSVQTASVEGELSGTLLFKRVERKSALHTKRWKPYHFVVDQRVLLCFHGPHSVTPKRAISLMNCEIKLCEVSPKYGETLFEVVDETAGQRYLLRANDAAQRKQWVDCMNREIHGQSQLLLTRSTEDGKELEPSDAASPSIKMVCESDMTPEQRRRLRYLVQMRIFIRNLTNICERLRFKERPVRKYFLKNDLRHLVIPPFAYIPLCNSTDPYQALVRALPKECHAFSTKARCPALMIFEIETHPARLDVATFLGYEVEQYSDSVLVQPDCELVVNFSGASELNEEAQDYEKPPEGQTREPMPTKFTNFNTPVDAMWSPEGRGFERLQAMGYKPPALSSSTSIRPRLESQTSEGGTVTTNTDANSYLNTGSFKEYSTNWAQQQGQASQGVLGETFAGKANRLRDASAYGHLPGFSVGGLIAKSNDDVRQEVFVIQLMLYLQKAFKEANLPVWMHTYKIMSTSKSTGLIELIPNSISFDGLKKSPGYPGTLREWYEQSFPSPEALATALENYVASMAAYSVVCYLLAIKDRHNGNVMMCKDGHIIHIDFGFVFGLAPGKQFSMEKAPWKLNQEMVDVMGGYKSAMFADYKRRCVQAFIVARKHAKQVMSLMEIMQFHSSYPAFRYNPNAIRDFQERLYMEYPENEIAQLVDRLIAKSYKHTGTVLYDQFQLATNGIAV